MNDEIFIQHRFTVVRDGLVLQDAITLPKAEYEAMTPEAIEATKEERFANFQEVVKNPPKEVEISKEDQIAQIDRDLAAIAEQKVSLEALKVEVNNEELKAEPKKK